MRLMTGSIRCLESMTRTEGWDTIRIAWKRRRWSCRVIRSLNLCRGKAFGRKGRGLCDWGGNVFRAN